MILFQECYRSRITHYITFDLTFFTEHNSDNLSKVIVYIKSIHFYFWMVYHGVYMKQFKQVNNEEHLSHFQVSVQFSSVQLLSHVWLCDPMNRSTPGLPVHHYLPEFTQTHIHRVSDAIQPSHPLLSPSPPPPNPSQHQGLFQWVSSSPQVAKELELQHQHQPFQIQGWFPLQLTGLISLQSKGLSRIFSNTTVKKHQFSGTQTSLWSSFHICTWMLEKP